MKNEQPSDIEQKFTELESIYQQKLMDKSVEKSERRARYLKSFDFSKALESQHGRTKMEKYRLFHVVGGSQPFDDGSVTEFDLPDGAIERFIREEL